MNRNRVADLARAHAEGRPNMIHRIVQSKNLLSCSVVVKTLGIEKLTDVDPVTRRAQVLNKTSVRTNGTAIKIPICKKARDVRTR